MSAPIYTVGVEFETGSYTDVTSRVTRFNVMRTLGNMLLPIRVNEAMVELANEDGRFSPRNEDSDLYGRVLPGRNVKISAAINPGLRFNMQEQSHVHSLDQYLMVTSAGIFPNDEFTIELKPIPESSPAVDGAYRQVAGSTISAGKRFILFEYFNTPRRFDLLFCAQNSGPEVQLLGTNALTEYQKEERLIYSKNHRSVALWRNTTLVRSQAVTSSYDLIYKPNTFNIGRMEGTQSSTSKRFGGTLQLFNVYGRGVSQDEVGALVAGDNSFMFKPHTDQRTLVSRFGNAWTGFPAGYVGSEAIFHNDLAKGAYVSTFANSNEGVYCSDSSSMKVSNAFELRVLFEVNSSAPYAGTFFPAAKWNTASGANREWLFRVTSGGLPIFNISINGGDSPQWVGAHQASLSANRPTWMRFTRVNSVGTFEKRFPEDEAWTAIGSVTTASLGATNVFSGNAPLTLGRTLAGVTDAGGGVIPLPGRIYKMQLFDNLVSSGGGMLAEFNPDANALLGRPTTLLDFREGGGTVAVNRAPNNLHFTLVNSPQWVDTRSMYSMVFSGIAVGSYGLQPGVWLGDGSTGSLNIGTNSAMTLEAWVYPMSNAVIAGINDFGAMISRGNASFTPGIGIGLATPTTFLSSGFFIGGAGGGTVYVGSGQLDRWHFVAYRHFGPNSGSAFVNSIFIPVNSLVSWGNSGDWRLGTMTYSGAALDHYATGERLIDGRRPFCGILAGVRVYNRAVTSAEILAHYVGSFADDSGLLINIPAYNPDESSLALTGHTIQNLATSSLQPLVTNTIGLFPVGRGNPLTNLFTGVTQDIQVDPTFGNRKALIRAVGTMEKMERATVVTSLLSDTNPASVFTEIMSQSYVMSFNCSTLDDPVKFAWFRDISAREALERVVQFGNYNVYEDGAGTIQLRERHLNFNQTIIQSLDSLYGMQYSLPLGSIVNKLKLEAKPRQISTAVNTVASVADRLIIPASGHISFWLAYSDPNDPNSTTAANSVTVPVTSLDFQFNSSSDGLGGDMTSAVSLTGAAFAESIICSLFNTSSVPAYMTKFVVRGYSLLQQNPQAVVAFNLGSINSYGLRDTAFGNELFNAQEHMRQYATYLVGEKSIPQDQLAASTMNQFRSQLNRELGTIVGLNENNTGVSSLYQVTGVEHDVVLDGGLQHQTTFELRFYSVKPYLILDNPVYGRLDSDRTLAF